MVARIVQPAAPLTTIVVSGSDVAIDAQLLKNEVGLVREGRPCG